MTEYTAFFLMAFGPGFLAAAGIFLLAARRFAEKNERKNNVPVNAKVHRWVSTVGGLLLLPFLFQMIAMLVVKLR